MCLALNSRWIWPGFDGSDEEWSLPRARDSDPRGKGCERVRTGFSADAAETCSLAIENALCMEIGLFILISKSNKSISIEQKVLKVCEIMIHSVSLTPQTLDVPFEALPREFQSLCRDFGTEAQGMAWLFGDGCSDDF